MRVLMCMHTRMDHETQVGDEGYCAQFAPIDGSSVVVRGKTKKQKSGSKSSRTKADVKPGSKSPVRSSAKSGSGQAEQQAKIGTSKRTNGSSQRGKPATLVKETPAAHMNDSQLLSKRRAAAVTKPRSHLPAGTGGGKCWLRQADPTKPASEVGKGQHAVGVVVGADGSPRAVTCKSKDAAAKQQASRCPSQKPMTGNGALSAVLCAARLASGSRAAAAPPRIAPRLQRPQGPAAVRGPAGPPPLPPMADEAASVIQSCHKLKLKKQQALQPNERQRQSSAQPAHEAHADLKHVERQRQKELVSGLDSLFARRRPKSLSAEPSPPPPAMLPSSMILAAEHIMPGMDGGGGLRVKARPLSESAGPAEKEATVHIQSAYRARVARQSAVRSSAGRAENDRSDSDGARSSSTPRIAPHLPIQRAQPESTVAPEPMVGEAASLIQSAVRLRQASRRHNVRPPQQPANANCGRVRLRAAPAL